MRIHGIRFYSKVIETVRPHGAMIFIHNHLSPDTSDFYYHFHPLEDAFRDLFFLRDYTNLSLWYEDGKFRNPDQELKERFGEDLYAHDAARQFVLLRGASFSKWAPLLHTCEGELVHVFDHPPSFESLEELCGSNSSLTSSAWPKGLRAILHNWDDLYWQVFTHEYRDIERLICHHKEDPRLDMFFVDLDAEFPNPSNRELQRAI